MAIDEKLKERVKRKLKKKTVFTLKEVLKDLACSESTAHLNLKSWGCICSYNANAKYYTFSDLADFNEFGIWQQQDGLFSKHGNLTDTLVMLVRNSDSGMGVVELENIVKLPLCPIMPRVIKLGKLVREKLDGKFIYFTPDRFDEQIKMRNEMLKDKHRYVLSDSDAVHLLVALISEPGLTIQELVKKISVVVPQADEQNIQEFLEHHDLQKKTLDSGLLSY